MEETKYYLWLLLTLGAASRSAVRLVRAAGSAKAVWEEPTDELMKAARIKDPVSEKLRHERDLSRADEIMAWCAEKNVTLLTPDMPEYPKSLLCIMDFPMVLFCMGDIPDLNKNFCCAVVGTRKMTEYGKRMAYNIGWGLGDGGAVVVSGLALGIDGMAMAGANAAGGSTVGVLGCGIDITYPPEHKDLFRRTLERGAIITEYPPGSPPARNHFPKRNRIISGLCQACSVIEADTKSGALITAKLALYQGRSVYAAPGNVGEVNSEGCNRLIREGATVLTSANDILGRFEFLYPHALKPAGCAPGIPADVAAGSARIVSDADPKTKYMGDGIYGGRKKKKRITKKVIEREAEVPDKELALPDPEASAKAAAKKTSLLRHTHVDMLSDKDRDIYYSMEPGTPMLPDEIGGGKYNISEILTAMTLLEIAGAVEAGAGGYFVRCSDEDTLIDGTHEG